MAAWSASRGPTMPGRGKRKIWTRYGFNIVTFLPEREAREANLRAEARGGFTLASNCDFFVQAAHRNIQWLIPICYFPAIPQKSWNTFKLMEDRFDVADKQDDVCEDTDCGVLFGVVRIRPIETRN